MTAVSRDEYASRIDAVRKQMARLSIDGLACAAGSDMEYLCGYAAMPLERLTMLVIGPWHEPVLVVPELEAPLVEPLDGLFGLLPWADGEDASKIAASEIRKATSPRPSVVVSDTMGAHLLLSLQHEIHHARWLPSTEVMRTLRIRKSPAEINLLRAAGEAIDDVVARYPSMRWEGRTEADIAAEIGAAISETHERVNFVIVASGPNGASPHHEAADRVVRRGDTIVVDVGGTRNGYCSDITRMVTIGPPDDDVKQAYSVLRQAQEAAVAGVKPGLRAQDVDNIARDRITAGGYGREFIHRTGHGIGLDEHEDPYIVRGNLDLLDPGMCFSVEPGIYVPGKFGLRLEDIVCVTESGVESLNHAPHDIVVID